MASAVSALGALMPVSLSSRTFFVKCSPVPKTFTDRRAVLKTLQTITENDVEVFRKLKDNSSFIAVTFKAESAKAVLANSPYQRILLTQDPTTQEQPQKATWGFLYNARSSITTPLNPIPAENTGGLPPSSSQSPGVAQKTFTIHCFPTNKNFDHVEWVEQDPLNGPWPDSGGVETYVSAALRQTLPSGHMAPGLRDWETGRQMSRDSSSFADESEHGAAATLLGKKVVKGEMGHILERMRVRKSHEGIPEIMKGLGAYAKKVQDGSVHKGSSSQRGLAQVGEPQQPERAPLGRLGTPNIPVPRSSKPKDDDAGRALQQSGTSVDQISIPAQQSKSVEEGDDMPAILQDSKAEEEGKS